MRESGLDPARHETSDVTRRFVRFGSSLVIGAVVILALAILWLFPDSGHDQRLRLPLPDYPQPALQQDPAADLRNFEREKQALLEDPRALNKAAGIPIEVAMRQIAEEKIAGWPGQKAETATLPIRRPESEHAAMDNAPNPSPPAAARHRSRMRHGGAGRPQPHRVPPKVR